MVARVANAGRREGLQLRLGDGVEGLGKGDGPVVEGAAEDGAFDADARQPPQVVERGDAPGRDDGRRHGANCRSVAARLGPRKVPSRAMSV